MRKEIITVSSIKDQIYQILKEEIINGTLKSGDKLVELNIASRFSVSRSPVREAIKQLVGDGLVVNETNRGACVKIPTPKEIQDMQTVRTLFEEYAIRVAVEHLSDQNRKSLERIRQAILHSLETDNYPEYLNLERELSLAVIHMCDNAIIEDDYIKVYTMMNQFSNPVVNTNHATFKNSVEERVALIDALLEGDGEKALSEVRRHAEQAREYINRVVDQYNKS